MRFLLIVIAGLLAQQHVAIAQVVQIGLSDPLPSWAQKHDHRRVESKQIVHNNELVDAVWLAHKGWVPLPEGLYPIAQSWDSTTIVLADDPRLQHTWVYTGQTRYTWNGEELSPPPPSLGTYSDYATWAPWFASSEADSRVQIVFDTESIPHPCEMSKHPVLHYTKSVWITHEGRQVAYDLPPIEPNTNCQSASRRMSLRSISSNGQYALFHLEQGYCEYDDPLLWQNLNGNIQEGIIECEDSLQEYWLWTPAGGLQPITSDCGSRKVRISTGALGIVPLSVYDVYCGLTLVARNGAVSGTRTVYEDGEVVSDVVLYPDGTMINLSELVGNVSCPSRIAECGSFAQLDCISYRWIIGLNNDNHVETSTVRGDVIHDQAFRILNHPNPFSERTTISFWVDRSQHVRVQVYDILGRLVSTLEDAYVSNGNHEVAFEAAHLLSGTYFCRISTRDGVSTHRMHLVR